MKKILVTGAKGMLGHDLCPTLEDAGFEVFETDLHNLDITNPEQVEKVLTAEKPDAVVHCAAYTNVNKAEEDTETAMKINEGGTENLAKTCAKLDIPIVYISTDYVFDGTKKEAYLPYDKPNPLNAYGLTKLKGEEAVQRHCTKFYITRTSWLYGLHGKNFVETMISLADKPELKVVDDQIGCPTWTQELADGITTLLTEEAPFGIYHICGSGKTSWYGFAKEIFELAGLKVNLLPCKSDEFPSPAKRPQYSVMYNDNICRTWKAALKDYMKLRGE
ncbi:MAG: dTDP-4-dehydrorhamnose reductase [Candidatus Gastranaerophilales bacterium]|nr:dTDP-4-dehydrorhamnose reductase [Candidatus Gastranaerophilales bacterium]